MKLILIIIISLLLIKGATVKKNNEYTVPPRWENLFSDTKETQKKKGRKR